MDKKTMTIIVLVLSIAGTLFAGYLTISKMINKQCVLTEGCPIFLGQPACLYGLIMFLLLFIFSLLIYFDDKKRRALLFLSLVSLIGILFSAYFTFEETILANCWPNCIYSLGIPTCIYGLLIYTAIFVFSIWLKKE